MPCSISEQRRASVITSAVTSPVLATVRHPKEWDAVPPNAGYCMCTGCGRISCMQHRRPSQHPVALRVPIPCALYSSVEGIHDEGTLLGLSLTHGHVETSAAVVPGMTLALFVILPGASRAVVIEEALVTWVRDGECGLRLEGLRPEDTVILTHFLRQPTPMPAVSTAPRYALAD